VGLIECRPNPLVCQNIFVPETFGEEPAKRRTRITLGFGPALSVGWIAPTLLAQSSDDHGAAVVHDDIPFDLDRHGSGIDLDDHGVGPACRCAVRRGRSPLNEMPSIPSKMSATDSMNTKQRN